ncbi:MAG: antibiotic biosynthesis monooxygenase [Planctomycetota bacterium]|nr:antibiotic biosynthesis monooxygenase [Planctomycetota bacterium]MDA1113759.1 antibiotic biosynthesis monooxygenase [Planctomycetota bacterium]
MKVGFAVLYRWRLKPGKEDAFVEAWAKMTELIKQECGGLGSRLHKAEDGTWAAYAQWPNRAAWAAMQEMDPMDRTASVQMREAVEESFEPVLMSPVQDLLLFD